MIFEEGNLVAHQKTVRGTHTGDLFGMLPTGRTVETHEVGIARFDDGKMVEFWGSFDEARLRWECWRAKRRKETPGWD